MLISHTELMDGLLRLADPQADASLLGEQLCDHRTAVQSLRAKCRRMLGSSRGLPS